MPPGGADWHFLLAERGGGGGQRELRFLGPSKGAGTPREGHELPLRFTRVNVLLLKRQLERKRRGTSGGRGAALMGLGRQSPCLEPRPTFDPSGEFADSSPGRRAPGSRLAAAQGTAQASLTGLPRHD